MSNRLALVGVLIAGMSVAIPSVTAAQNPWRADPQASGQYMPQATQQSLQVLNPPVAPKYAPLDGKLDDAQSGYPGYPGYPVGNNFGNGFGYGGVPYQGGVGYPGAGYPGAGYPSSGYPGVGYPGLGSSGLGYPGISTPGLGWGGYPYRGGGNGFGGPTSWSPFW